MSEWTARACCSFLGVTVIPPVRPTVLVARCAPVYQNAHARPQTHRGESEAVLERLPRPKAASREGERGGRIGLCRAAAAPVIRVNASPSSSASKSSCSDPLRAARPSPPSALSSFPPSASSALGVVLVLRCRPPPPPLLTLTPPYLVRVRARPHIDFVKLVSQGTARRPPPRFG